jgi:hypothetical protein
LNKHLNRRRRSTVKKTLILALAPLALLVGAHAATGTETGVTTSTDPAKAAAVERHAQELAARDATAAAEPKKAKTGKTTTPKTAHKTQHHKHHAAKTTTSKTASK